MKLKDVADTYICYLSKPFGAQQMWSVLDKTCAIYLVNWVFGAMQEQSLKQNHVVESNNTPLLF